MLKKYFKTKDDFLKYLFLPKNRQNFALQLGINFKSLYDITNKEENDGKWAGRKYYTKHYSENSMPTSFPVVMCVFSYTVKYNTSYIVEYIYLKDFKIKDDYK